MRLTGWKGEDDIETGIKGVVGIVEKADYPDTGSFFS